MQASDRFNINSQLEHLQSKYVGTGHADLTYLYDEQNLNCASGAVHTIASVSARACGCVFVALRVIVCVCVCALAHTFERGQQQTAGTDPQSARTRWNDSTHAVNGARTYTGIACALSLGDIRRCRTLLLQTVRHATRQF